MQSPTSARGDRGQGSEAGTPPAGERGSVPFATATVATIYLDQGKLDQAEQIFRRVLEADPDNRRCRDGLAEIERRRQESSADAADAVDAEVAAGGAGRIACSYRVSQGGRDRARLVSGEQGQLTLRLVGFPAEQDAKPLDTALSADTGDVTVEAPAGASLAAVSIGILGSSGTFVSIAHSKIVQLAG